MAKKEVNEDILSGGSISEGGKKKAEKAPKKSKAKKSKISISKNAVKAIKSAVACIVVVALLVAYVGTGTVRKGFIHSTLQWTTAIPAVSVKSDDGDKITVSVATFNYYFAMQYNNIRSMQSTYEQYGLSLADNNLDVDLDKSLSSQTTTNDDGETVTWLEYLYEEALESIKNTYIYYNEAVKANGGTDPEITEEQQTELNDTINQYKETANGYGFTVSGYFVQAFGKGVTEKVFRREATRSYIAQNYQDQLKEQYSTTEYSDEDYDAYKTEHQSELEMVSLRIFEAANEDEAKAFYSELKADGSNFTDLCVKYSESDYDKAYYADANASTKLYATRSFLQSGGYAITTATTDEESGESTNEGLDWIFSTDRSTGDTNQVSTSVVYMIAPVAIPDVETVNVRHILIAPETDDESTSAKDATTEQWAAALEKAQSILDQFNSGDGTEEDFAALAVDNSADSNAAEGGIYNNVYPGKMVDTFGNWCFEDGRKTGDTAIVQTEYGYHIMYFVGQSGMPVWQYTAQQALASADSSTYADTLAEKYTVSFNWFGKFYIEKDTDIDH